MFVVTSGCGSGDIHMTSQDDVLNQNWRISRILEYPFLLQRGILCATFKYATSACKWKGKLKRKHWFCTVTHTEFKRKHSSTLVETMDSDGLSGIVGRRHAHMIFEWGCTTFRVGPPCWWAPTRKGRNRWHYDFCWPFMGTLRRKYCLNFLGEHLP